MRIKALLITMGMALLASAAFGQAATGAGDPHLAKAVELRAQAQAAYGTGDYDTAAALARQAKAESPRWPGPPVRPRRAPRPRLFRPVTPSG